MAWLAAGAAVAAVEASLLTHMDFASSLILQLHLGSIA